MSTFTQAIRRFARRAGLHIERICDERPMPLSVNQRLDVFDLAVRAAEPQQPSFFFVQIGAHDGLTLDPIRRYVMRYHWRGILLEPQPEVYERLRDNYRCEPQLRLLNAAISDRDGYAQLYCAKPGSTRGPGSLMASFCKATLSKHVSRSDDIEIRSVPTVSFSTLLRDVERLDLVQIDTEGYDFEVLKMVLSTGRRPPILHFEHMHLSETTQVQCAALLAEHGYRMASGDTDTVACLAAVGTTSVGWEGRSGR